MVDTAPCDSQIVGMRRTLLCCCLPWTSIQQTLFGAYTPYFHLTNAVKWGLYQSVRVVFGTTHSLCTRQRRSRCPFYSLSLAREARQVASVFLAESSQLHPQSHLCPQGSGIEQKTVVPHHSSLVVVPYPCYMGGQLSFFVETIMGIRVLVGSTKVAPCWVRNPTVLQHRGSGLR